jgi:hypothetical protein
MKRQHCLHMHVQAMRDRFHSKSDGREKEVVRDSFSDFVRIAISAAGEQDLEGQLRL